MTKRNKSEKDELAAFKFKGAELEEVDAEGNGRRLAFEGGLWRAWHVMGGKVVRPSSGRYNTAEDALEALDKMSGGC